ncbi:carboxylesterase family protein, partial [Klebsiella pneumoniae]|uniref:carboxylesterase family protein n=1 Tax=Klebsiella pneumoniae TaxID=573 RepID=UPI00115AE905
KAGCANAPDALACLRAKSTDAIFEAGGGEATRAAGWRMVIDGDSIPDNQMERFARGEFHRVPILVGFAREENGFFLQARRAALGGHIPRRQTQAPRLAAPAVEQWARFALSADGKEMSSTMAIVRMLTALLKDPQVGPRIVPIVADEARTFGMANLFRQIGIYSAQGQLYEPEDIGSVLYYREARDGQILEEG